MQPTNRAIGATGAPTVPRRILRASCLITGAVAASVFIGALWNGFAFDDRQLVQENPRIATLGETIRATAEPYWFGGQEGRRIGLWRPLSTLYLGSTRAAFGADPRAFHAGNVLFHAACSVLVLLLAAELLPLAGALTAGLMFAVHPVHTEAVANVVGVSELLSSLSSLLAVLLFLRWRGGRGRGSGESRPSDGAKPGGREGAGRLGPRRISILAVLYLVAVLFKESAIVLPALLLLLDAALGRSSVREAPDLLRARGTMWLALGGVAVLALGGRFIVLGSIASPAPPLGAELLGEVPRIWTVATVWPHYFRLMLFPWSLSPEYAPDLIPVRLGWSPQGVAGVVLVLGTLLTTLAIWRRATADPGRPARPAEAWTIGVLWFSIAVLPVSNLLFLSGVLLAERTLYLPSVGFALVAGAVVVRVLGPDGVLE